MSDLDVHMCLELQQRLREQDSIFKEGFRQLVERAERAEAALENLRSPQLATHQPCGCQLCVCPDEWGNQCSGCGAHSCSSSECVIKHKPENRVYDDAPSYTQLKSALTEERTRREETVAMCEQLKAQVKTLVEALEWAHKNGSCGCGEACEHPEDCIVAAALASIQSK